jgi:dsRNA-specific ribonuclease
LRRPPIFLRLPTNRRRLWVLELEPVGRSATAVPRSQALRDDAFEAHLAGVLEDSDAIRVLKVFVQPHAVPGLAQDARQRRLAHRDRLPPQVRPVQLQQVEGIEESLRLIPAMA